MKIYLGIVWLGLAATACGGDGDSSSGIDQSRKANSLSSSEVTTFCRWALAEQGGAGHTVACGGGDVTITVPLQVACEASYNNLTSNCTATVGDAETCVHALSDDPCELSINACLPLYACSAATPRR